MVHMLRCAALAVLLTGVVPNSPLAAQQRSREPAGFDFSPTGVWRQRARNVSTARAAALSRGEMGRVNAAMASLSQGPAALAVTGVLQVPVFLVRYRNSQDSTALFSRPTYQSVLFDPVPPSGRPYTIRTYYEELSNGLFSMQGQVIGWITLDSNDTYYEGANGCNGLCGSSRMGQLLIEAVQKSDAGIDFSQFDNDGPDGIPNSADDDGVVDLAVFVHPEVDGACGGNSNIWAHRWVVSGWTGSPIPTDDVSGGHPGQNVSISDYTIQSGVGGGGACSAGEIMPPGTVAHETGHGLGLPDFYDTNSGDVDDSEGIGEWGLMGSGNYARPLSPAHMTSFALNELGWVTVLNLTASGTTVVSPIQTGDTAYIVRPTVANPRGEYFLFENRQRLLSDTALITRRGGTGGLLVWHVDSTQYRAGAINSGAIHALWLLEADGIDNLRSSTQGIRNRGDAGDPFPGTAGTTRISYETMPSTRLNTAGNPFAGFLVDSIRQVVPNGAMAFRVRFGGLTVVRASDSAAVVRVRGASVNVYRDAFDNTDTATVDIDPVQFVGGGRSEFTFVSWSDGGARTHTITGSSAGLSLTAAVTARHRVVATANAGGTVTASGGGTIATGVLVAPGDSITLTAVPNAGQGVVGWTGDTTTSNPVLVLHGTRPYAVAASFVTAITVTDSVLRAPVMAAPYADTLRATGGIGIYTFSRASGTLPAGLTLFSNGVISGTPTRDTTYTFTVRVASGTQVMIPMSITVVAPTLQLSSVISQFLGTGTGLTPNEITYLDLAGNQNFGLDIGDLMAWLDRTGTAVSAEVMTRIMRRAQP